MLMRPYILLFLALVAFGKAQAAVPSGCTAAAAKYPGASVACDNAALVSDLLTRTKWSAKSSETVQEALKKSARTPGVYGAAMAFTPAALKKYNISKATLYSPYCHAPANATSGSSANIECIDIGDTKAGGYDYTDASLPQTKWFTQLADSAAAAKPSLSGVYFDKGGGDIWMDTLSVPVLGPDGKLAAVATADVRAKAPANATAADAAAGPASAKGGASTPAATKSAASAPGMGYHGAAVAVMGVLAAAVLPLLAV